MISGDTSGAFRARNKTRIGTRRVGAFGLLNTGDYPGRADLGGNFIGTEANAWARGLTSPRVPVAQLHLRPILHQVQGTRLLPPPRYSLCLRYRHGRFDERRQ